MDSRRGRGHRALRDKLIARPIDAVVDRIGGGGDGTALQTEPSTGRALERQRCRLPALSDAHVYPSTADGGGAATDDLRGCYASRHHQYRRGARSLPVKGLHLHITASRIGRNRKLKLGIRRRRYRHRSTGQQSRRGTCHRIEVCSGHGHRRTDRHDQGADLTDRGRSAGIVHHERCAACCCLTAGRDRDGARTRPHRHRGHQLGGCGGRNGGRRAIETDEIGAGRRTEALAIHGDRRARRTVGGCKGEDGELPRGNLTHLHEVAHGVIGVLRTNTGVLGDRNDAPVGIVYIGRGVRDAKHEKQHAPQKDSNYRGYTRPVRPATFVRASVLDNVALRFHTHVP